MKRSGKIWIQGALHILKILVGDHPLVDQFSRKKVMPFIRMDVSMENIDYAQGNIKTHGGQGQVLIPIIHLRIGVFVIVHEEINIFPVLIFYCSSQTGESINENFSRERFHGFTIHPVIPHYPALENRYRSLTSNYKYWGKFWLNNNIPAPYGLPLLFFQGSVAEN